MAELPELTYRERMLVLKRRARVLIKGRRPEDVAQLVIALVSRDALLRQQDTGLDGSLLDDAFAILGILRDEIFPKDPDYVIKVLDCIADDDKPETKDMIPSTFGELLGKGHNEIERVIWGKLAFDADAKARKNVREVLGEQLVDEVYSYEPAALKDLFLRLL